LGLVCSLHLEVREIGAEVGTSPCGCVGFKVGSGKVGRVLLAHPKCCVVLCCVGVWLGGRGIGVDCRLVCTGEGSGTTTRVFAEVGCE